MKKFWNRINWKLFWRYELIVTIFLGLLYLNSIQAGRNIFPENFYVIFLIPGIFGFMILLQAHTKYIENKIKIK